MASPNRAAQKTESFSQVSLFIGVAPPTLQPELLSTLSLPEPDKERGRQVGEVGAAGTKRRRRAAQYCLAAWLPVRFAEVEFVVREGGVRACLARAGDVWLYSTPILHASERASQPAHRRVLQIDYSPDELPEGLEWQGV